MSIWSHRRMDGISARYPQAPASEPGTRATVLVALAITRASAVGRPSPVSAASSAGKVNSVPPPARELTIPAARAERHNPINDPDVPNAISPVVPDADNARQRHTVEQAASKSDRAVLHNWKGGLRLPREQSA